MWCAYIPVSEKAFDLDLVFFCYLDFERIHLDQHMDPAADQDEGAFLHLDASPMLGACHVMMEAYHVEVAYRVVGACRQAVEVAYRVVEACQAVAVYIVLA